MNTGPQRTVALSVTGDESMNVRGQACRCRSKDVGLEAEGTDEGDGDSSSSTHSTTADAVHGAPRLVPDSRLCDFLPRLTAFPPTKSTGRAREQ